MMDESPDWQPQGVPLRLDPEAGSAAPTLPAFLDRPQGAPVYHGFLLLEESRTADGWCFGSISDFDCPEGRNWGDAFIVAPDGSRAGIVWEVGAPGIERIMLPDGDRWGFTRSSSSARSTTVKNLWSCCWHGYLNFVGSITSGDRREAMTRRRLCSA
jgi:hypothetical protein